MQSAKDGKLQSADCTFPEIFPSERPSESYILLTDIRPKYYNGSKLPEKNKQGQYVHRRNS